LNAARSTVARCVSILGADVEEELRMVDAGSISVVLAVLHPERDALVAMLESFETEDWSRSTECPAYTVKGIAIHVLGDDLSLLSRQRDGAENGLVQLAAEMPGADFRILLDAFNDRWVAAGRFLSIDLVIELLRLSGDWTAGYYEEVDPAAPGEPVGFFGATGSTSPFWHAIAREYMERWVHHSQIRRAVGRGSLADARFLSVGVEVAAAASGVEPGIPTEEHGSWTLGPVALGPSQQAADILTRAHTAENVRKLATGPPAAVELLAAFAGQQ
jgi:uncharacterized protein (TIGR03083 family)